MADIDDDSADMESDIPGAGCERNAEEIEICSGADINSKIIVIRRT